jgi:broad specificity phosphatase PhoE
MIKVHCFLALSSLFLLPATMAETNPVITKTIFLIRHAESVENQRSQSLKTVFTSLMNFTLPSSKHVSESLQLFDITSQVDTNVSEVGEEQIVFMADTLAKEDFVQGKQIELVMHSPLQRARQTSKGLLQCLAGNELEAECKHTSVTRVVETPLLVERTPSEWMPGNFEGFRQRIRQWEDFVLEQPEERIAVVGHSQFFKSMLNLDFKFGNCHVWEVQLNNATAAPINTDPNYTTLSPRWSGLKQLYDCSAKEEDK